MAKQLSERSEADRRVIASRYAMSQGRGDMSFNAQGQTDYDFIKSDDRRLALYEQYIDSIDRFDGTDAMKQFVKFKASIEDNGFTNRGDIKLLNLMSQVMNAQNLADIGRSESERYYKTQEIKDRIELSLSLFSSNPLDFEAQARVYTVIQEAINEISNKSVDAACLTESLESLDGSTIEDLHENTNIIQFINECIDANKDDAINKNDRARESITEGLSVEISAIAREVFAPFQIQYPVSLSFISTSTTSVPNEIAKPTSSIEAIINTALIERDRIRRCGERPMLISVEPEKGLFSILRDTTKGLIGIVKDVAGKLICVNTPNRTIKSNINVADNDCDTSKSCLRM